MPDILLTCQNCHNPFVYSEFEQTKDKKTETIQPVYCPICRSIKASEALRPAKPQKQD